MATKVPYDQRCANSFERKTKGRMYVNARWRCPRKKLLGSSYCSYCEPSWEKADRLAAKVRL